MTFFSRRSRAVAGISVLAVLIAVGGAATAALAVSTSWSAPADLSAAGQGAFDPQVTVDGSGLATAVWYRYDGSNYIVQASTSLNGAPWSTPANLSVAGQDAFDPQVTVDGSGFATAVWYRFDGSNFIVQASFFDSRVPIAHPVLAATGVDTATVALTSIFALLAMFTGIGMIRIRRRQATPTVVMASQQRQHGRKH